MLVPYILYPERLNMYLTAILTAFFFFLIGYLVEAYPNTISGYNTMSSKRKEYVDIDGLSSSMKRWFIIMGAVILFGCTLLHWLGLVKMALGLYTAVIIFGTIYTLFRAQEYDHYS